MNMREFIDIQIVHSFQLNLSPALDFAYNSLTVKRHILAYIGIYLTLCIIK